MTGGRPEQGFHFGPWVFDIDAARALIASEPRDTLPLDVTTSSTAYGLLSAYGFQCRVVYANCAEAGRRSTLPRVARADRQGSGS